MRNSSRVVCSLAFSQTSTRRANMVSGLCEIIFQFLENYVVRKDKPILKTTQLSLPWPTKPHSSVLQEQFCIRSPHILSVQYFLTRQESTFGDNLSSIVLSVTILQCFLRQPPLSSTIKVSNSEDDMSSVRSIIIIIIKVHRCH